MSRALSDIVRAYKNMDIENMRDDSSPVAPSNGLLSKPKTNKQTNLDTNNPAVRVAQQMKVIRKHRDEIKNARS